MPASDMPGIDHFGAFLMGCAVLNLTPGLDTFYILARSSREGRVVGIAAALGINAGCLIHTVAAVLGVSTILATSAAAIAVLFLPPFVSPHAANVPLSLLVLGLSFIATGLCWSMVLALVGARFRNLLEARPAAQTWMDRVCGAVLVGFGSLLAIQQRR